jgi:hypothetical protein
LSILLDGTLGITTPGLTNTGTETIVNLTTTGNTILGDASTDTLNVGNGGLVKDASGNVGIGVPPSAWGGGFKAIQVSAMGAVWGSSAATYLSSNEYFDGSSSRYITTQSATDYTQYNGQHVWYTAPSGTAGNAITFTQAMTLDASGNLLVGQTAISQTTVGASLNGATGTAKGTISSALADGSASFNTYHVYSTTAAAYRFYVGMDGTVHATATSITAISDQRLKENIRPLVGSLDLISRLKPVRFDWKEGKGLDRKDDLGFIAQEFESVFPASVVESLAGGDGIAYKSLNHSELIPTLTAAIQELNAKFEEYKASHP